MGSAQSMDSTDPDPWWPTSSAGRSDQTVPYDATTMGDHATTAEAEARVPEGKSTWQRRQQELCRTIQHLAEENMRLASIKRELEYEAVQAGVARRAAAELEARVAGLTAELVGLRGRPDAGDPRGQSLAQEEETAALHRELVSVREQLARERESGTALSSEVERLRLELRETGAPKADEPTCAAEGRDGDPGRDMRVAEEIERFKVEMSAKRQARHRAMAAISSEMERLRRELAAEREASKRLSEELGRTRVEHVCDHAGYEELYKSLEGERDRNEQVAARNERLLSELDNSEQLLVAKTAELEELRKTFDLERDQYQRKISSLKEVVSISKQLLSIREKQVGDLESKMSDVKNLVRNNCERTDPEAGAQTPQVAAGLRLEYQAQLENIKSLKSLYDERMKVISQENDKLCAEIDEANRKLETEQKRSGELETEVAGLRLSLSGQEEAVSSLQTQLDTSKDEAQELGRELTLINNLFTQMLVSNNGSDIDLDKLTKSLQENHDLISEITLKEDSSEIAACLPKLLLELVAEVDKSSQNVSETKTEDFEEEAERGREEPQRQPCMSCQENNVGDECSHNIAAEDIALNLPKVWKVLMELLSHHVTPTERPSDSNDDCCYKRVDTPYGPRLAISVSKTFLRLKDLILEKKSLKRELTQLKQLNCHLESRLSEQEQRLSLVSSELHKTWSVVGRMRTQHQQLHNHEKILRYELQQKRKLLTELKQELEYCRETWEMARAKNSQSEAEWHILRKEFASRKKNSSGSMDNSGESGFSDDKEDDSGGEDNPACRTTSKRGAAAHCMPESPPGHEPPDIDMDVAAGRPEPVPGTPPEVAQIPALVVDVSHEQFLSEEVCPLKSPPTPEFLESSARVTVHDDESPADTAVQVECPVEKYCGLECSTISLISLLKQQLSCFSKNLEEITSDFRGDNNHQALQSIFFLPDIKVPYYDQRSDISKVKCANCSKQISADDVESSYSSPKKEQSAENQSDISEAHPSSSSVGCPPEPTRDEGDSSLRGLVKDSGKCERESTEGPDPASKPGRTPEQVLAAREARLRRLEEQCKQLVQKVTSTSNRSVVLSSRLEELHEQYGEAQVSGVPEAPPCPAVLPPFRILGTPEYVHSPPTPPPMPGNLPVFRIPIEGDHRTATQSAPSSQPERQENDMLPPPDT